MIRVVLVLLFIFQQDPRQIVEEAQRRTNAQSQRYEGTLQVVDAKSKITEKIKKEVKKAIKDKVPD